MYSECGGILSVCILTTFDKPSFEYFKSKTLARGFSLSCTITTLEIRSTVNEKK